MKKTLLENKARRAANRVGLIARKSARLRGTRENLGGFMLVDSLTGVPIDGFSYDLEPEAVIHYCEGGLES